MAGKDDDFFGNGTGPGEGEEANLDDFFQPAVSEPGPESAPPPTPPAQEEPQFPVSADSAPEVQPFPEETPVPQAVPESPPAAPPPPGEPSIESLFPTERGSDQYAAEESSGEAEEAVLADETGDKPARPRISLKVPRLAIIIVIGVLVGAVIGGGGYFGYRYFLAGKGKADATVKKAVEAPAAFPVKRAARPGAEGPSAAKGDRAAAVAGGPAAEPDGRKMRPYKPEPQPQMPQIKKPPKGTWSVHLERLALESSVAKDAEIVRKAGLTPYRVPESRNTRVTEFIIVADYAKEEDAHSAAWKIHDMGYRPRIEKKGNGYRVEAAVTFSASDAGEIRRKLDAGGVKNVKVLKERKAKKLQALRAGPFRTRTEALEALKKLKSKGFPHAMVLKN